MAKNNHSRIQGFNTFHLVQRKNYDLYCSCVCCSSQHHSNAKTKLSNRAGLSFFYSLRITYSFRGCKQSNCAAVIVPMVFRQERIPFCPKIAIISCFRTAVLLYWYTYEKQYGWMRRVRLRSELTISSYFLSSCLGLRVLGSKPNQSSRPGISNTDSSHRVVLQAFVYKTAKPREATNILEYKKKLQSLGMLQSLPGKLVVLKPV